MTAPVSTTRTAVAGDHLQRLVDIFGAEKYGPVRRDVLGQTGSSADDTEQLPIIEPCRGVTEFVGIGNLLGMPPEHRMVEVDGDAVLVCGHLMPDGHAGLTDHLEASVL